MTPNIYAEAIKAVGELGTAAINKGFEYGEKKVEEENLTERNFDNGIAEWAKSVIQTGKTNFGPWLIIIVALVCITTLILITSKNKNK